MTIHPFAYIANEATEALDCLTHLTTDEFSRGGDRPARLALARILDALGEPNNGTSERDYAPDADAWPQDSQ